MKLTGIAIFIILIFNITVGALCVDYSLGAIAGVDVPLIADILIGLVAGQVVIPLAIVCFILSACGVVTPFFG